MCGVAGCCLFRHGSAVLEVYVFDSIIFFFELTERYQITGNYSTKKCSKKQLRTMFKTCIFFDRLKKKTGPVIRRALFFFRGTECFYIVSFRTDKKWKCAFSTKGVLIPAGDSVVRSLETMKGPNSSIGAGGAWRRGRRGGGAEPPHGCKRRGPHRVGAFGHSAPASVVRRLAASCGGHAEACGSRRAFVCLAGTRGGRESSAAGAGRANPSPRPGRRPWSPRWRKGQLSAPAA